MSLKQSFYQKPCWYYQGRLCRRASVCALYLRLLILFLTRQQQQQTVSCLCEPAYTRQEVKPMAGSAISHVVGVAQTRRLFHFPLHRWYLLVEGLERSFEDLGLSDNKVIPVFIWSFRLHFDVHPLRFSCYLTSVCLFKFFSRFFFFFFLLFDILLGAITSLQVRHMQRLTAANPEVLTLWTCCSTGPPSLCKFLTVSALRWIKSRQEWSALGGGALKLSKALPRPQTCHCQGRIPRNLHLPPQPNRQI